MMKAIDLRAGQTVLFDGELYNIHEVRHVVKGKGGSCMQVKLKNLKTATMIDRRLNVNDKVEIPFVESKEFEYLYPEGNSLVIMDTESYDQIPVDKGVVGDAIKFLKPNERVTCEIYDEKIISFQLPIIVELEITDTPPVVKGATATNQLKEAVLETGAKVRVPPFISNGERIRVDTRTGNYIERAK